MEWISRRTHKQNKTKPWTVWHEWFAWYPVTVYTYPDGRKKKVWLSTVEQRGEYEYCYDGGYWNYEYRPVGGHNEKTEAECASDSDEEYLERIGS